ncbi:unnamed protein product [Symbiodinium sp. CCMP2592]|nr:unnamed protein product [Symbiodinium sp. CCMP2592]
MALSLSSPSAPVVSAMIDPSSGRPAATVDLNLRIKVDVAVLLEILGNLANSEDEKNEGEDEEEVTTTTGRDGTEDDEAADDLEEQQRTAEVASDATPLAAELKPGAQEPVSRSLTRSEEHSLLAVPSKGNKIPASDINVLAGSMPSPILTKSHPKASRKWQWEHGRWRS